VLLAAAVLLQTWLTSGAARCLAEDAGAAMAPAAPAYPYRFEARLGAFAHGVGSVEDNTVDLNVELVFPRLPFGQDAWLSFLVPRPHVGGMVNLSGKTSYVYGGALWTVPLWYGFFAEGFFGGAIHDGSRLGTPTQAALGCNPLFSCGRLAGLFV
jgi:lipid A 3-O-deacylase